MLCTCLPGEFPPVALSDPSSSSSPSRVFGRSIDLLLRRSARHAEHAEHDQYDKPDKRVKHDEPTAASTCSFHYLDPVGHCTLRTCIAGGRSSAVWLHRRQRRRRDPRDPSWRDDHHPPQRERPVARDDHRFDGRVSLHGCAARHLHGDGEARGLQAVHTAGCGRHAQQRRTRRRAAPGGPAQRGGNGVGGTAAAADRSRRGAIRAAVESTRESAGIAQPQLPVPLPGAPGLHAARGGPLGTLESVARARLQRQWREPQLQQHPHRRGQHDQHLAAARRGLRACARIARYHQHRHEQLRCGAGAGGRIGHQRA